MRFPIFLCFVSCVLVHSFQSFSQDKIYLSRESKTCKIVAITSSAVTYTNSSGKGNSVKINTPDVILIFNKSGNFLIPSKLDFAKASTEKEIKQFLSAENNTPRNADELYTIAETKMEVNIIKQDSKFIYLSQPGPTKIDKRRVAAIIYKTGLHSIYPTTPVTKVAAILWATNSSQKEIQPILKRANSGTETKTIAESSDASTIQPATTQDTTQPSVTESKSLSFEEISDHVSQKEFEEKAVKKTKDLNSYLKILCTKSYGYEEHNKAMDQAINLFINEDATVTVSSITRTDEKSYKIRQYLLRLKSLNYDRVEVEWTNVQYVTKLTKGTDGNYYGTVTFEQVFRGFIDGKIAYQDITKKSATVILKAHEKSKEGSTTEDWDVMLSDIGVVFTKSQG